MSKKIDILWIVFGAGAGVALYLLLWWISGFDCFAGQAVDHLRNLIFLTGGITAAMIATWRAQVADEQAKTAYEQAKIESKKADVAEQTQITDRFARAIEQLNNDNVYIRIGAIQVLERIGYDSKDEAKGILRLLAGFVRNKSPAKSNGADIKLPPDAKECLGVIGRLARNYKEYLKWDDTFRLDLSASILIPFPVITRGHFHCFDFDNSIITYQVFSRSDFEGTSFFCTDLTNTRFLNCNFVRAIFMNALLKEAKFHNADMTKASMSSAICNDTDFSTAKNLTTEMLKDIIYDAETPPKVPEGVDLPHPREKQSGAGQ